MPFRKDRPRPTAYHTASMYPAADDAWCRRTVVLSTGRGHVRIDPDEARALAAELLAAAEPKEAIDPCQR